MANIGKKNIFSVKDETTSSDVPIKSLATIASETLASTLANVLSESKNETKTKDIESNIKEIQESFTIDKNSLALVFVLDNTASQSPSWELIKKTINDLIPFLDSRHGETNNFSINYEIVILYANDYTVDHFSNASRSKRSRTSYLAKPREKDFSVVGELARISSDSTNEEKEKFINQISSMECYGGNDPAEAYAPALELALENINNLSSKYGDNAVVACIFCGDDIPHGYCSQSSYGRDNWPEGDPSGIDWYDVISRFNCPIHCLSPPHADADSRCALGLASKLSGGFHIVVDDKSSVTLLRLLMAEMKLSWLVERNLKDMESATPEEISTKIAELANRESFVKPTNTVPEDPRIEKLEEEFKKSGPTPFLMRTVSSKFYVEPIISDTPISSVERGVSDGSVMRALKTASGGKMAPELMRAVSSGFAKPTRRTSKKAKESIEYKEDEIPTLTRS